MIRRRCELTGLRRWLVIAALAAVAAAVSPRTARAQSCDGDVTVFTEDWLLAKVDCGVDAAIDSGTGMLSQMGVNLLGSAVDSFLPGLGKLMLGAGDPFAGHAARIIEEINAAERRIVNSQLALVESDALYVDVPVIEAQIRDLADQTWEQRLASFQAGAYTELRSLLLETQISLQNQPRVFGVRALHSLALVVGLSMLTEPERIALTTVMGYSINLGRPPSQLTEDELADARRDADDTARGNAVDLLDGPDGYLRYLRGLSGSGLLRRYSDDRFTALEDLGRPGGRPQPGDPDGMLIRYRYYVAEPASNEEPTTDPVLHFTRIHDQSEPCLRPGRLRRCFAPGNMVVVSYLDYKGDRLEVVTTWPGSDWTDDTIAEELYHDHRDQLYWRSLAASYGALRPTADEYYSFLGVEPPELQIDRDLDDFLMSDGDTAAAVRDLVLASADQRNLADGERRALLNYVLVYGSLGLVELVYWAAVDRMGGPAVADYLDFVRGGETPTGSVGFFRGRFAAKISAIL